MDWFLYDSELSHERVKFFMIKVIAIASKIPKQI